MQKIDKSKILSTAYKKWEEELEATTSKHHKYDGNAAKFKFYQDVIMNLFHCQNGLCAYTEQQLCPSEFYEKENWSEVGKYIKQTEKVHKGELDHFDESLKTEKGWLWDNLFMIESDTNNLKGTKNVDNILKPDRKGYNPDRLLVYLPDTGRFEANPKLLPNRQKRVNDMLKTLGINHANVCHKRKKEVELLLLFPSITPREFPTAIRMSEL